MNRTEHKQKTFNYYLNKENRENQCKIMKEISNRPENKEIRSKEMLRQWKDEKYRNQVIPKIKIAQKEIQNRPEMKEFHSKESIKRWANPEYKERVSKSIKDKLNEPGIIEK